MQWVQNIPAQSAAVGDVRRVNLQIAGQVYFLSGDTDLFPDVSPVFFYRFIGKTQEGRDLLARQARVNQRGNFELSGRQPRRHLG